VIAERVVEVYQSAIEATAETPRTSLRTD
jgi:hypothetical protein